MDKMKAAEMETTLEPVFYMWKTQRKGDEALGDFLHRMGKEKINAFVASYTAGTAFKDVKVEPAPAPMLMGSLGLNGSAGGKARKSTGPRTAQVPPAPEHRGHPSLDSACSPCALPSLHGLAYLIHCLPRSIACSPWLVPAPEIC